MPVRRFRLLSIGLCLAFMAAMAPQARAMQSPNDKAEEKKDNRPGPLILDDIPQSVSGNHDQDDARRDKVEALALFSAGRAAELREQYPEALRLYQRAFRCDPESAQITRAIIPLAIYLKRDGMAVRYALKSVDLEKELDPTLLRRLGVWLEEEADWAGALNLFQRAMSLRTGVEPNTSDDVILRMETGRLLALTGKFKEAADCFAVVVDAFDHPDKYALSEEIQKVLLDDKESTYAFFGDCFLQAGRIEEARAAYEKTQQSEPNPELRKFHLAQVLAKSGKPAEALDALDESLSKRLANAGMKPYELLEELLAALGKKDELIARLKKLRENDPQNASLGYFLADKYLAADMSEKAQPLYVELLDKNPTPDGYISLLEIYRKTRQYDSMLSILGEIADKTGDLNALGTETISLSKDPKTMLVLIDAARKQLKEAPEKPSFGKCFALGFLALDARQWETAGEFFQQAATAQPDKAADSYYYLAGALAMQDRSNDALAAARKAAELKKNAAKFRSRIAWIYFRDKRYDEALAEYLKILKDFDGDYENDDNRESLKEVRMELSNICVLQKKIPEAVEWLQQVLDEFPDDIGAMNDLGYLWADENRRLTQALKMIRKAVDAEPDNGAYRDSLGWALYRLGRWDQAISELQKASELQMDGEILDHLGDAYQKFHQPEKARDAWLKAAELLRKDKNEEKAQQSEAKIRNIDKEIKQNKI